MRQLLAIAILLAGCTGGDAGESDGKSEDASAQLACRDFALVADDASAGVLTDAELREGLREVYDEARVSSIPRIRSAARDMLAAATAGDVDALRRAVKRMDKACSKVEPL